MSVSFLGSQKAESGALSAGSRGTVLTANASAHTKGVWAPIHTATTIPAAWVLITHQRLSQAADALVDIGIGAASSEQVIIANVPISQNAVSSPCNTNILVPLHVPSGSRISARVQSNPGALNIDVQLTLFAPMFGGEKGLEQVESCGALTGTTLGTTIPGHASVANTKGTWTPLIASTSFAYRWVCLGITHTNAVASNMSFTLDIGVGASSAEVVVVPDLPVACGNVADAVANGGKSFPLSIPAGSRISARCQASVTTASDKDLELVVLGVG